MVAVAVAVTVAAVLSVLLLLLLLLLFNSILYYLCAEPTAVRPITD
jgi:hypothetical protein